MLLSNAVVDYSKRISILAAASPRQCDNHHTNNAMVWTMNSSSALVPPESDNDYRKAKGKRFNKMTRDQVILAKNTSPCKRCGNYGHWFEDHNKDDSSPNNMPSSTSPIVSDKFKNKDVMHQRIADKSYNGNRVLKFSNATTISLTAHPSDLQTEVMTNEVGHFLIVVLPTLL